MANVELAENKDTSKGFILAAAAYGIWGFLPLYIHALAHIPAWEVVPHRILWSLPLAWGILWWQGLTKGLWTVLKHPRTLMMATLTAALLTVNWGVYVWAVGSGRAIETALGYYINPLFSVLLASVVLGEKLARAQMFAILLAVIAVGILAWDAGGLPWVSLALTVTWGLYAYFKKTLPVGASQGFFLEVVILCIPAVIMLMWFEGQGTSHFGRTGWKDMALLAGSGVVTAIPLMLYANGAKLLRLSTIAIMQYSAPSMIFLIAVFIFKEPFSMAKLVAFCFIWTALAIYTWSLLKAHRER